MRMILCPKHGRVERPCRACKTQKYLDNIKSGAQDPKFVPEGAGPRPGDLTQLQIRFRAFAVRTNRNLKKAGRWSDSPRMLRVYPATMFGSE